MNWSSFKYLARQGLHSMVKNRLMSVASIGVLTVCLLITGVAGLFTLNVGSLMDYLGSQNETVVYLKEDLTEEGLAAVDSALRSISGLREVTYVSKDEALERMKESMGESAYLFDVFEGSENPFYANYRVVLDDVSDLPEIMPQLEAIEGVESVGVTVGLIAGVISTVLVLGAYQLLLIYAVELPGFWGSLLGGTLMPLSKVWYLVLGGFLAFGMLIGSLGTASSIRKYLKV